MLCLSHAGRGRSSGLLGACYELLGDCLEFLETMIQDVMCILGVWHDLLGVCHRMVQVALQTKAEMKSAAVSRGSKGHTMPERRHISKESCESQGRGCEG